MKSRLIVLSLAAALLLALGAIATACGDGDKAALEEYFQQLQALADDAADRQAESVDPQIATILDASATDEDRIAAGRDAATSGTAILKDGISKAETLEPPEEAVEAHNEFIDASEEYVDFFEAADGRLAEAESALAVIAEFVSPEFSAASKRFEDSCSVLEEIAQDNDIELDLQCEPPTPSF
jgi:hypothetical protein